MYVPPHSHFTLPSLVNVIRVGGGGECRSSCFRSTTPGLDHDFAALAGFLFFFLSPLLTGMEEESCPSKISLPSGKSDPDVTFCINGNRPVGNVGGNGTPPRGGGIEIWFILGDR